MKKPRYLVSDMFTADPSAHVFNGRIYIYPSHDIDAGIPENDLGDHFDMRDYHVFSMDSVDGEVTDHGVALDVREIPWAGRQLWAPDVACKDGSWYLYFPMKDKNDIFRIGVASAINRKVPLPLVIIWSGEATASILQCLTMVTIAISSVSEVYGAASCSVSGTTKPLNAVMNPKTTNPHSVLKSPGSRMICWNWPKSREICSSLMKPGIH